VVNPRVNQGNGDIRLEVGGVSGERIASVLMSAARIDGHAVYAENTALKSTEGVYSDIVPEALKLRNGELGLLSISGRHPRCIA